MDPSSLTCLNMSTWSVEATRSGVDTGIAYYFSHTHTYIYRYFWIYTEKPVSCLWIELTCPYCCVNILNSLDARPAINKRNIYHHISCKTHETFSFLSSRRQHTPALCIRDTWCLIIPKGLRSKPPSRLKDKGWDIAALIKIQAVGSGCKYHQ